MAEHRIYRHGSPDELTDGLWQVRGALPIPLPRYMTILRLASGGLMIYSAIAMTDEGMDQLEALGRPEVIVAPHLYHCLDVGFYKQRYPDIQLIAPRPVKDKLASLGVSTDADISALSEHGIRYAMVRGSNCAEVMLDLDTAAGRALVFTDCLSARSKRGFLLKLLGPPDDVGTPRIVRYRQIDDKPALAKFFAKLGESEVDMLVMAHTPPITTDCEAKLRMAAGGLG